MSYFAGGRMQAIQAGELGVFWAGMPHRLIGVEPGTRAVWITIPLAWVMRWELATGFTRRLLAGDLLIHVPQDRATEEALLNRWVDDLSANSAERRSIALLEVEASHRRLALASSGSRTQKNRSELGPVEKLTAFVSTHYEHDLDIATIAAAADLHPNYAMQLFKRTCGMSLWDYLTRLRVSHAQRLLLLTDWKVSRIALDSGFNSHSRFYESFVKICGKTPKAYRRSIEIGGPTSGQ
jgi:AraC-like DNA-binding protein